MSSPRRLSSRLALSSAAVAVTALCAAAPTAHAGSRAWTAAKKVLPAGLKAVVGVNAGPVRASQLFAQLMPLAMDKLGDGKDALAKLKTSCQIDLVASLDSAVMAAGEGEDAAVVVALKGVTRTRLEACIGKLAVADGKKLVIAQDGKLTRYSGVGPKAVIVRWLGKDTFVAASTGDDRDLALKMTAGGITHDKVLRSSLAKVRTGAALWLVVNKSEPIAQLNANMEQAYGAADLAKGNVSVDLHVVLDSAKAAMDSAGMATTQLSALKASGQVPPQFAGMIATLMVTAAGRELIIRDTATEQEVLGALKMLGI